MRRRLSSPACLFTLGLAALLPVLPVEGVGGPQELDPRDRALDLRVSVAAQSVSLRDLLSRVASCAAAHPAGKDPGTHPPPCPSCPDCGGLRLRAARAVEGEPVIVFAQDRTRREVMAGLGRLLNDTWEKESDREGSPQYRLALGSRALAYERSLRLRTLERGAAPLFRLAERLERPAEYYRRLEQVYFETGKEPDDLLLRPGNRLNLASLTRVPSRAALELLATLSPEQRFALLDEERYLLRWPTMTPRQQHLGSLIARDIGAVRERFDREAGRTAKDWVQWIERFGLVLQVRVHPVTGAVTSYGIGEGGAVGHIAVLPPATPELELLPVRGNPYEQRRRPQPPVYPELAVRPFPDRLRLETDRKVPWSQVLERLAALLPVPVFSDDFPTTPAASDRGGKPLPDLARLSLPEGLDALCEHYRYLWWYEEGTLFFRSRTWFIERAYLVSPSVVDLLRRQIETRGRLDVEAFDPLSRLTARQLIGLNAQAAVDTGALGVRNSRMYRVRMGQREARIAHGYLRVFAALNSQQKTQVLSPGGLPLARMSPPQRELFTQLVALEYGPELLVAPERLRLRAEQTLRAEPGEPKDRLVADLIFSCRERAVNEAPIAERLTFTLPEPQPAPR